MSQISRADWEELQRLEEACDCIEGAETGGEHHEPHCAVAEIYDTLDAACVKEGQPDEGQTALAGVAELPGSDRPFFTDADGARWYIGDPAEALPTYTEVWCEDGRTSWRATGLIQQFPASRGGGVA